jgi:hypothetical protein
MKRLMGVALLCVASSAMAADWQPILSGPNGELLYHVPTVKRRGDLVTFWEKTVFNNLQQLPLGGFYDTMFAHRTIDCAKNKSLALSGSFQLHGKIVSTVDVTDLAPTDITPDSTVQADKQALCKH